MVSTTAGQNPVFQARFAAITQLAVFEAVNAIDKDFDPYLGTVAAPPTASAEAAAVVAAHAVLKNYFPANANAPRWMPRVPPHSPASQMEAGSSKESQSAKRQQQR